MGVYRKISEIIVNNYECAWEANSRMKETCICGVEAVCSTAVNVCIIAVIAMILHIQIEAMIFFITFAALRMYAGGAHASNYRKCISIYVVVMVLSIMTAKCLVRIDRIYGDVFCIMSFVITCLINYIYAAKQKDIGNIDLSIQFRKKVFVILGVIGINMFLWCFIQQWSVFYQSNMIKELILVQAFAMLAQSIALFMNRKECINLMLKKGGNYCSN